MLRNYTSVLLALFSCTAVYQQINGYPYGYTKLYRDSTDTVVDLIYDVHINRAGQSVYSSYDHMKQAAWPTERYVLNAFEHLNSHTPYSIDLLWESSPTRQIYDAKLISNTRFLNWRFPRLLFKHSDTWRHDYANLFFRNGVLRYGVSFNKPVALNYSLRAQIAAQAGPSVLNSFESYANGVDGDARHYFRPFYEKNVKCDGEHDHFWEQHCHNNNKWHTIADAEMIAHILGSDKPRIILYAGGAHCERIVPFLKRHGYRVTHDHVESSIWSEMPLGKLTPLATIHFPLPRAKSTGARAGSGNKENGHPYAQKATPGQQSSARQQTQQPKPAQSQKPQAVPKSQEALRVAAWSTRLKDFMALVSESRMSRAEKQTIKKLLQQALDEQTPFMLLDNPSFVKMLSRTLKAELTLLVMMGEKDYLLNFAGEVLKNQRLSSELLTNAVHVQKLLKDPAFLLREDRYLSSLSWEAKEALIAYLKLWHAKNARMRDFMREHVISPS